MLEILNAAPTQSGVADPEGVSVERPRKLQVLARPFPYRNTAFDPIALLPVPTNSSYFDRINLF